MTEPTDWTDLRLYGRRQGKPLRRRPQALMDELLPHLTITPANIHDVVAAHQGPVWLEVGFGGGEHLAWQAAQHPDVLCLGAEPFLNGVAKLLDHVASNDLKNVRILHGDVRPLLAALPNQSLGRLFVLHPDPWPKKRHFKRRMVSQAFLQQAARALKPGGELRVSSDIPDYIRWTLMQVQIANREGAHFHWTARSSADWLTRPADWPQTRYETKGRAEGRPPAYLSFVTGVG